MSHLGKKPQDFYHALYAQSRNIVDASSLRKPDQLETLNEQLQRLSEHGAHFTLLKRASLKLPEQQRGDMGVIELMQQNEERIQQEAARHLQAMAQKQTWKFSQIFCIAPSKDLPHRKNVSSFDDDPHVKLATIDSTKRMMKGNDSNVYALTKNLRRKTATILRLLPEIGKIALVSYDGIEEEIENIDGSGTLFIDPMQTECGPIRNNEKSLIASVHDHYTKLGMFRRRSKEELAQLMDAQHILRIKKSPLGGGSLLPVEGDEHSVMLEGLWAHPLGNGLGKILLQQLLVQAETERVLALTKNPDAMKLFMTNGFTNYGAVSRLRNAQEFPRNIREYSKKHPGRNPHLFVHEPGT